MPVHEHVCGRVAVANGVASGKQGSSLAQVNTEVGEGLVLGAGVGGDATHEEIDCASADRGGEGLDLADLVGVLPKALLSERAQEVECAVLVEVILIEKLSRSLLQQLARGDRHLVGRVSLGRLGTGLRKGERLG